MTKLLNAIIFLVSLNSFAMAAARDDASINIESLKLVKLTTLAGVSEYNEEEVSEDEIPPKMLGSIISSKESELYGFFGIQAKTRAQETVAIGLVLVDNAYGSYYYKKSEAALGFSTGEFGNLNIFLKAPYQGKGLLKPALEAVWEQCAPFTKKHHTNWSPEEEQLVKSRLPFQGLRGIIELSNVPSLRGFLKCGWSLASVSEVNSWVVQWPPKAAEERTPREQILYKAAEAIIAESLESFRGEHHEPRQIPSTEMARLAVSKHYPAEKAPEAPNLKALSLEDD